MKLSYKKNQKKWKNIEKCDKITKVVTNEEIIHDKSIRNTNRRNNEKNK